MYSFTACLRQIIVVQQSILEDDGLGGKIETWKDLEMLSAEAKALYDHRHGESFTSIQLMDNSLYRFRVRYNPKITSNMRVAYAGKIFKIRRIINEEERNTVTVIIAQESV